MESITTLMHTFAVTISTYLLFFREIRKPLGPVYFAGTETATYCTGYMDGAIQAGERAAREILCELGRIKDSEVWQEEPSSEVDTAQISCHFIIILPYFYVS